MIGYLKGEILEHVDGRMIVAAVAQPGSAVGYQVSVPNAAAYVGHLPGKTIELYIHTHVREDALDLYGFASRLEKDLFLTLLSVTGIGPKGALGILSGVEPEHLIQAIVGGDKDALTKIPGIGKKTAERVVLELADPIRKKMENGGFGSIRPAPARAAKTASNSAVDQASVMLQDAKAALVGLGYREQEVTALLNRVISESATPPARAEDLIRTALRQLA